MLCRIQYGARGATVVWDWRSMGRGQAASRCAIWVSTCHGAPSLGILSGVAIIASLKAWSLWMDALDIASALNLLSAWQWMVFVDGRLLSIAADRYAVRLYLFCASRASCQSRSHKNIVKRFPWVARECMSQKCAENSTFSTEIIFLGLSLVFLGDHMHLVTPGLVTLTRQIQTDIAWRFAWMPA